MKQCDKCGAVQSDNRTLCVDCGAPLGSSMTAREEELVNAGISDIVTELTSESSEFHVSVADKILGALSVLLIAVLIVMLTYANSSVKRLEAERPDAGYGIIVGPASELDAEIMCFSSVAQFSLLGIVFFASAAAVLLLPKLIFMLDSIKYRIWFEGSPSPSALYLVFIRFAKYTLFALGCGCLSTALISLL